MKQYIIKRNGEKEEFDYSKICIAINKAMEYGSGIVRGDIALLIGLQAETYFQNEVTIQEIEQFVYHKLIEYGESETARAYEGYRAVQEFKRNTNTTDSSILGLMNRTNEEVMTENANKNGTLASTQRDLVAGEISKDIARRYLIPPEIMQANDEGTCKLHDLDYFSSDITNCELVNLKDMLDNGTVINKKMIESPKSLRTAMTIATQISAQVASFTYGGQTMSLSHLAPYVCESRHKIEKQLAIELKGVNLGVEKIEEIIELRLRDEIKDAVQTFNYQISTLNSTNGQSPFVSLVMYISEDKQYEEETAMLIEEFLKQRIVGMKNEHGVVSTQTFPKLLYFLDENNMTKDSKYYYLTELASKSIAKRMSPDLISVKRMKAVHGIDMAWGCINF